LSRSARAQSRPASRSSARLGMTLRSLLTNPSRGFESAVKAADRRQQISQRPAEGVAPYVLSAIGGAALLLLWLKLGGLVGLRDATTESYRAAYLALTIATGAALGLIAQVLWGVAGARVLSERASARDMRLIWGAASLPLCVVVLVLLPLDLVIVGPEIFTTERLDDPLATAWAAFSMAVALVLALWASYLFVRGLRIAADDSRPRVGPAAAVAVVVLCAVFVPPLLAAKLR
jgi:Yip1 domain